MSALAHGLPLAHSLQFAHAHSLGIISDAALKEGLGYRREALAQPSTVTDQQMVNFDFVKTANDELKKTNFKP